MTRDVQNVRGESASEQPLATSSPVPRRRISPWIVVILGVSLFCLAFAVLVGVIALVHPGARPVVRGLQERRMADGTILVLEKVTVGSSHQFEWQRKQSISDWINGNWTQKHVANAWSPGESIVVWFSRRDPATGASLDVDWWLRSAAIDDLGAELDDDNAGRNSFSASGSSVVSGSGPLAPEPAGKYEMIVAHSAVRPFRHAGNSFKLRVYDTAGTVVAEFDVPHANPGGLPVWRPEPLPATKAAGDLDVT